jgi:omega-6 fatty acid desaturase (delta-12 desaturase)
MSAPSLPRLRRELAAYRVRPLAPALVHFVLSLLAHTAALYGVARGSSLAFRIGCGLVAGVFSGNLFMIGHDACHGSYTQHRWLNRVLGRVAFLPSWHPYSVWEYSHNRVHHGHTNLRGKDFVWAPLSKQEFERLPWLRRALYRTYRTPLGLALYYPLELWRERLFFPRARFLDRPRRAYTLDCLLVSAYMLAQATLLTARAESAGAALSALALGVVVPWLVFGWLIGFVVFFNHTHPSIVWYDGRDGWSPFVASVHATMRLSFPRWTRLFASQIMNHPAHHVDPRIPLARLRAAEERLEQLVPGQIVTQEWSVAELCRILRVCRLYDFESRRWTDYDGTPTSP